MSCVWVLVCLWASRDRGWRTWVVLRVQCPVCHSARRVTAGEHGRAHTTLAKLVVARPCAHDGSPSPLHSAPPYILQKMLRTQRSILTPRRAPQVADLASFDVDRTITLVPPEGEFALMNYRTSHGLKPPFRLSVTVDADPASDTKALLTLRLWCAGGADERLWFCLCARFVVCMPAVARTCLL